MRALLLIATVLLAGAPSAIAAGAEPLFADPVVAKARDFEIRRSDIDEGYLAYKAARAALGQRLPDSLEDQVKQQVLDKLIATKLFLARATPVDREEGKRIADRLIAEGRDKAPTEASYRRQLIAVGTTPEKYEADILEQAIVKAVIDRELKHKRVITGAEVRKFYDDFPSLFEEPEKVRVAHILLATRAIPSGEPLTPKQQREKQALAERVLARARAGEDFKQLIQEFSEDPDVANTGGELTFGPRGPVPPEFEAAAFTLQPGQISSLVRSVLGYHIIKLIENLPATRAPFEKVEDRIRDILADRHVQESLAGHLEKLKKEAGLEILELE